VRGSSGASLDGPDGICVARAFREGVDKNRRMKMRTLPRRWPERDFAPLIARTEANARAMGPSQPIEALIRIENDHWIFERADPAALAKARHRIVVHEDGAPLSLGGCTDMTTALDVARRMAENDGRVVLIEPV
jgi:hypothetical protein